MLRGSRGGSVAARARLLRRHGPAALLYTQLSPVVEAYTATPQPLSAETRRILWRIGSLFGLDAIAGGFLTATLLTVFFHQRFQVDIATIGALFFAARIANAWSHVGAAWLARRFGLVNTMVFTHIPSSLLLVTVAYAPTFRSRHSFLIRESWSRWTCPPVNRTSSPSSHHTSAPAPPASPSSSAWPVGPSPRCSPAY
jgi:hypothetical protein